MASPLDSNGPADGVPGVAPLELWRHASPQASRMHQFKHLISHKYGVELPQYEHLYRWSIENIAAFWKEVWHFTGVRASEPFQTVTMPETLCLTVFPLTLPGGRRRCTHVSTAGLF